MPSDSPRPALRRGHAAALLAAVVLGGCYTVHDSQRYFREASEAEPSLELLHQTALYNVFYDHALRRCVLHSSYTWGERGGSGGGTGLGVAVFACDPAKIKARVHQLRFRVEDLRDPGTQGNPRRPADLKDPYPPGYRKVPAKQPTPGSAQPAPEKDGGPQ